MRIFNQMRHITNGHTSSPAMGILWILPCDLSGKPRIASPLQASGCSLILRTVTADFFRFSGNHWLCCMRFPVYVMLVGKTVYDAWLHLPSDTSYCAWSRDLMSKVTSSLRRTMLPVTSHVPVWSFLPLECLCRKLVVILRLRCACKPACLRKG